MRIKTLLFSVTVASVLLPLLAFYVPNHPSFTSTSDQMTTEQQIDKPAPALLQQAYDVEGFLPAGETSADTKLNPVIDQKGATLFAYKGSFIREGVKNANEGGNEILRMMGNEPIENRVLVEFDQTQISTVMAGKSLQSAKLRMYIVGNDNQWGPEDRIGVYRLLAPWLEGDDSNVLITSNSGQGVTWNCMNANVIDDEQNICENLWNGGTFDNVATSSVQITSSMNNKWIEFDVTEDIKKLLSGTQNYGWLIKKFQEDNSGRVDFASDDASSNIPELVLSFS